MASPAVVGTPAETAITGANTSHVVNLPAGAVGNLFVAVMDKGSTSATVNALAGWTELLDEALANGLYIAVRECDGTEGATTTFTLSAATRGAWIVYEVSGAEALATILPQVGTTATGSSTTPDPPSVAVTGGSKDILSIACFGRAGEEADDDTWVTAAPTSYTNLLQKACGIAGTNLGGMIATAQRQVTTATEDPATFTCATGAWRAQTIVIHPATIVNAAAEVAWTELEVPLANADAEVAWAELEVPTANSRADIAWAELEVPNADAAAQVAWAELEVPNLGPSDAAAEISWAELEVPTADAAAHISWAELEVPTANAAGEIAFASLEVPFVNANAEISWVEFEIPSVGAISESSCGRRTRAALFARRRR